MTQLLSQPRFAWLLLLAGAIAGLMPPEQIGLCLGADGHFAMSRDGTANNADCPCAPESTDRSPGAVTGSSHPSCRDFAVAGTSLGLDDLRPSLERATPAPSLVADPVILILARAHWDRLADCAARRAAAGMLLCQRSVVLLI